MPTTTQKPRPPRLRQSGTPAYGIAQYFPMQGHWSETDYLALDTAIENQRFIELVDGRLEVFSMPTLSHEDIVLFLFVHLMRFAHATRAGVVYPAGAKLRLRDRTIRMPDILFVRAENKHRRDDECYMAADLVMEVVSKGAVDRKRDLVDKRAEYAEAGISEYWIVDPHLKQIQVLTLNGGKQYKAHGVFKRGEKAASKLLKGFEVDVTETLVGLKQ